MPITPQIHAAGIGLPIDDSRALGPLKPANDRPTAQSNAPEEDRPRPKLSLARLIVMAGAMSPVRGHHIGLMFIRHRSKRNSVR